MLDTNINSLRYLLDNKEIASLYVKQDKKNINLTLSQLIQLHYFAYSRQPLFQRQVSDFETKTETVRQ